LTFGVEAIGFRGGLRNSWAR